MEEEKPKDEVMTEEPKEKESEMKELMGKLTELINQLQKKEEQPKVEEPKVEEPKAEPEEPAEEVPEDDKKKKVMNDSEMFEITANPKWAGFVKEMKEKDANLSLQEIAEAFKNQKSDKMSEKISELSEKLNKFEARLQEPAKVSMHASSKVLQEKGDPDGDFLQLLKERRIG